MDKLSAFLSLSNCCFVVTGAALVSPGMIIEGSLNGLVKARLALSCSILELGAGKTEQPSAQPNRAGGHLPGDSSHQAL